MGTSKFSSKYSRGLKASIERLLGRSDQLRQDLSNEQLSELIDTMLTNRGLSFTVVPKKSTLKDYVTTVTLRAKLDDVRDRGPFDDATYTSETKQKTSAKLTDEKSVKGEVGVRPRVWHPFSSSGTSHTGGLSIAPSKNWAHSDAVSSRSSEGTKRTHGDTVKEDGTVGSQQMRRFDMRLTITPEVQSYVRTSQLVRGITPGMPGKSVPKLVDLSDGADSAPWAGQSWSPTRSG